MAKLFIILFYFFFGFGLFAFVVGQIKKLESQLNNRLEILLFIYFPFQDDRRLSHYKMKDIG